MKFYLRLFSQRVGEISIKGSPLVCFYTVSDKN